MSTISNLRGASLTLEQLLGGDFELYGQEIIKGTPNIQEPAPAFVSGQKMERAAPRQTQVKDTKNSRKKDPEPEQSDSPHASPTVAYKAILGKGSNYRNNAVQYLKTQNPGRGALYNTFNHLGPADFKAAVQARAGLSTPPANFNPTLSGTRNPYRWNAHHLIPQEAFYTRDSNNKPVFEKDENFALLLQCEYFIDHGHNLILLPTEDWAVPVHSLIAHPNQHDDYTMDVISKLKALDKDIDALRGRGEDHEAIVANIFENLKCIEDMLWQQIISLSKKLVATAANGGRYSERWVRWRSGKGRVYTWGSLW